MGETNPADEPNAADVAAWLRRHPHFLKDYPDLAGQLEIPRDGGQVASLATYQLEVLRRKNRELEGRLAELLLVAGDNEQRMMRVHAFNISLMRADSAAALLRSVVAGLTEDFSTDLVRILLYRPAPGLPAADWLLLEPAGPAALPAFAEFLTRDEPQIGRLAPEMLEQLFDTQAPTVQSAALMRLGGAGMMAIGSHDANRFHPGMGGVFLKLIGEAVSTALARHQSVA